jgi:dethiobiotin synthetase
MRERGVFVTGTGTEVGKTVVAASVVAALAAGGERVAAFKPAVSGLEEANDQWPPDHELLAAATGWQSAGSVSPHLFEPAVSPHLAAELAGETIDPFDLAEHARRLAADADLLVCEGVGGLMVPLTTSFSVLDLAEVLRLPAVVVAQPGLGTISDTRLTVDRLREAGINVAAVVLNRWPAEPSRVELSNRATLEELLDIEVATLGTVRPSVESLARAGASLPLRHWLAAA